MLLFISVFVLVFILDSGLFMLLFILLNPVLVVWDNLFTFPCRILLFIVNKFILLSFVSISFLIP